MIPNKVCPVIVRRTDECVSVLAFRHPLAGFQLVKGGIETGETPEVAALRELREESGINDAVVLSDLGVWDSGFEGQFWSFQLCRATVTPPEKWVFRTVDDGGHDFEFFWHPLDADTSTGWHSLYRGALDFLRSVGKTKMQLGT